METAIATKQDPVTMANRTADRLGTYVGHTEKRRRKVTQALMAAMILQAEDWHINFDAGSDDTKKKGFKSVWQFMAYHHPRDETFFPISQATATDRERWQCADRLSKAIESGCRQLQEELCVDTQSFLYIVPRQPNNKRIEVITLLGDFVVNTGGQTAREVTLARKTMSSERRVRAYLEDSERLTGDRKAAVAFMRNFIQEEARLRLPEGLLLQQDLFEDEE